MPRSKTRARATREDVCRAVGVSTATVSRVLNGKPGAGPEVRRKVLDAVRKLNYVPRAAARNLSGARTDTIGVVFQDLTSGWLLTVFRGILITTAMTSYRAITSLSAGPGDELDLPSRMLADGSIDGLLWCDPRATAAMIAKIKKQPLPFVVLQAHTDDPDVSTVSIENTQGAYQAMRHLLGLGRRRLMLITGARDNVDSQQRLLGAQQALREFDLPLSPELVLSGDNVGSIAVEALAAFLAAGRPPPDAVFAFNDDMALAVLRFLREKGYQVPGDVAVVGFDGIEEAAQARLTTVETPMRELGVTAAQLLTELIQAPPQERQARQILLKGNLRIRETCGAARKQE